MCGAEKKGWDKLCRCRRNPWRCLGTPCVEVEVECVLVTAVRVAVRGIRVCLVKRVQSVLFGVLCEMFAGFLEFDGGRGDA